MKLSEAERAEANALGLSESAAVMAKGLNISLAAYAKQAAPATVNPVDQAEEQAGMLAELARLAPTGRERLLRMAEEARDRAAQLRAEQARGGAA